MPASIQASKPVMKLEVTLIFYSDSCYELTPLVVMCASACWNPRVLCLNVIKKKNSVLREDSNGLSKILPTADAVAKHTAAGQYCAWPLERSLKLLADTMLCSLFINQHQGERI